MLKALLRMKNQGLRLLLALLLVLTMLAIGGLPGVSKAEAAGGAGADDWAPTYMGTPWAMELSPSGTPHVGTSSGVYKLVNDKWTLLGGSDKLGIVRQLGWSSDGVLTVAAKGIWQLHQGLWQLVGGMQSPLAKGETDSFVWLADGTLVVGNRQSYWENVGVWQFSGGSWQRIGTGGEQDPYGVTKVAVSPAGVLTAGTESGNGLWQYLSGKWSRIDTEGSPITSTVQGITWGPDGSMVVSTLRDGMQAYRDGEWTPYDLGTELRIKWVNTFVWAPDGSLTVGTVDNGVWSKKDGVWTTLDGGPIDKETVTVLACRTAPLSPVLTTANSGRIRTEAGRGSVKRIRR